MQKNGQSEGEKRDRRRSFRLWGIVAALAFAVAYAEGLVRWLYPYNTPDTFKQYSLPIMPAVYARHLFEPIDRAVEVDGEKAWGVASDQTASRQVYFINRHGYRGPSFDVPKPAGLTRIVVLGGSTVFDKDATEGNDWPHLVERLLKEKGYTNIEVINAGIPGQTSADLLGRLFAEVWLWEPDYILVYEAWNDIKYFGDLSYDKPLIRLVPPLNPNDPFKTYQGSLDYLMAYSQLYVKMRNKYFHWKYPLGPEGVLTKKEPKNGIGPQGFTQFRHNMELLVDGSKNIHAVPILLTQATLVAPNNTEEDRKKIAYGYVGLNHEALVQVLEQCRQVILDVAREKGIAVLDVAQQLSGRRELFTDHNHTTEQGSQEIARRVTDFLAPLLRHNPKREAN